MKSRTEKLLGGLNLPTLVGAEIGPLHNPLVRRGDGHIIYVDHKSAEELRAYYAGDPDVNTKPIEVDAIWGVHTLREAIDAYFQKSGQASQSLDYVVASHVIEHVPDLVTWLQEIRSVLTPTGQVRLAVPDKRYTFDYLRHTTQLDGVLEAYLHRARIPNTHCLLDFCLNYVTVDIAAAWQGPLDVSQLKKFHTLEGAAGLAIDAMVNGTYIDVHCWVFTPQSFANLFVQLAQANLIDFSCEEYFDSEYLSNEFIVNLRVNDDKAAVIESWQHMAETFRLAEQQTIERAAEQLLQERLAQARTKQQAVDAAAAVAAAEQAAADAQAAAAAQSAIEAAMATRRPRVTGIRSALKAIGYVIKG